MFDKLIKAPGKLTKEVTKAAAQLPAVPVDVANKAVEGVEEGTKKAERMIDGRPRPRT